MTTPAVPAARLIVESALFQTVMAERDKYRAALNELRFDHQPDRGMLCIECHAAWPCVTADYLDEILGRTTCDE